MKIDSSKINKIAISNDCGIINVPKFKDCSFILPQIEVVFKPLKSIKIKKKGFARPVILKTTNSDLYVKSISENIAMNGHILHTKRIHGTDMVLRSIIF